MKKTKILTVLLCIAMILSCVFLPACNSDSDADKAPNDPPASSDSNPDNTPADPDNGDDGEPEEPVSKLSGKTIIWNGDSICKGATDTGTWADRIATWNGVSTWKNYGVGGGTITENVLYQNGSTRHSVSATLDQMHEEYPNADYVIIEGGTNDADLLGRITQGQSADRFGTVSPNNFSGNYDRDTFCGALESVFYRAKQLWPNAKICYIVAQKMGTNPDTSDNRYAYFQAAMDICEKWEIPYLNLWDDCELDPTDVDMYNSSMTADQNEAAGSMYRDGQHLTAAGYDLTTEIIDRWLKTL